MDYESFHSEKPLDKNQEDTFDDQDSWFNAMPNHDDEIIIDEDGPELKTR